MSAPIAPMEALLADRLPDGDGWQYEPKWDGFRCIAVSDGGGIAMWSKSGKSLDRYFPEIAALIGRLKTRQFVLDGELVIQLGDEQAFEALQARLHPAESRVRRLAAETPAQFIAFDLLALGKKSLAGQSLRTPAPALEKLAANEKAASALFASPKNEDRDGRRLAERSAAARSRGYRQAARRPYHSGERAMVRSRSAVPPTA